MSLNLPFLPTQESHFVFNDILYKPEHGMALELSLAPIMVNVFLSLDEIKWLEQCPNELKPVF